MSDCGVIMLSLELNNAIDAVVQGQPTHIGFVAINTAGEFLITEPKGHPYGVSATERRLAGA
jgi:hypothetical protein